MSRPLKVLLELRPALAGHAGIPQETRLLYRAFQQLDGVEVEGMIQSGSQLLAPGLDVEVTRSRLPPHEQINRLSRVVVSLQEPVVPKGIVRRLMRRSKRYLAALQIAIPALVGRRQTLTVFDPTNFRDFVWRSLFAKSLPPEDFGAITAGHFRIASVPYGVMHVLGLLTARFGLARYPRLDARVADVLLTQTPYPARVVGHTRLVVRYCDAVPLLMPHTITDKAFHQAMHYYALRSNVRSGAHFVCNSDATRRDLESIFPEVKSRAVTIPCMLSHHFWPEDSSPRRVDDIIAKRVNSSLGISYEDKTMPAVGGYLLMVSTIEPRKNHLTLLAAWEQLKAEKYPNLHLVCVGSLGWDHEPIVKRFRPWLYRGEAFLLEDVPADELRLLYRHALVTVCPSLHEGFGYSGVEAMRCGGAVTASDIPVHREIYGEAAEFFNAYSVTDAARAIDAVISPERQDARDRLLREGAVVSLRYTPEAVGPQWQRFFASLNERDR